MSYIKYLKRKNQRAERKIDSLKKMIDLLRVEREQLSWSRNAEIDCDPEGDESSKENARQFELSSLRVQNSALLARLQQAGVLKPGEQVGLYPPLIEESKALFGRLFMVLESVIGHPEGYEKNGIPLSAVVERAEKKLPELKAKLSSLPVKEDKESETKLALANDLWSFLIGLEPMQSKDTPLDEGNLEMMKSELAHHKKGFERLGKLWKFLLKSFWFPVIYPVTDYNIEELKERITRTLSSLSEAEKSSVNGEEEIPPLVVYPDKEGHTKREHFIASVLHETGAIAKMLIEKNQSYGNSALDPIRLFSKSDAREQIRVRIDDKLSRIQRGKEYPGDNDVNDLIGYLFLYKISLATD